MRGYIAQRVSRHVAVEHFGPCTLIHGARLHEFPIVKQLHAIVIKQHVTLNNLARTRVRAAGSHRVLDLCGNHSVAIVANIIGIEVGIIGRVVLGYEHILESYLLKSLVPIAYTLFYIGPRSEEHTSELQSRQYLVCRLLLEKK